jgi:hypothetical protein
VREGAGDKVRLKGRKLRRGLFGVSVSRLHLLRKTSVHELELGMSLRSDSTCFVTTA